MKGNYERHQTECLRCQRSSNAGIVGQLRLKLNQYLVLESKNIGNEDTSHSPHQLRERRHVGMKPEVPHQKVKGKIMGFVGFSQHTAPRHQNYGVFLLSVACLVEGMGSVNSFTHIQEDCVVSDLSTKKLFAQSLCRRCEASSWTPGLIPHTTVFVFYKVDLAVLSAQIMGLPDLSCAASRLFIKSHTARKASATVGGGTAAASRRMQDYLWESCDITHHPPERWWDLS
eukprot:1153372-Pelagomonas_calceolata.AAC.3